MPFYFSHSSREEQCERATSTGIIVYGTETEARKTRQEGAGMANQKHLDILKQGVETWNLWRKKHPSILPDLSNADLNSADLDDADLNSVDLSCANLGGATLHNADLGSAELSSAELMGADLSGATLHNADFNGASVGYTSFGDVNLSTVQKLETVLHQGPSTIGIDTIYHSQGNIPEAVLEGAGIDDTFITYIRSLVGKPIE